MVTGDRIGYWHYFDPNAYGIEVDNHGRMPVWGYAKVIESQREEVEVGKVIYGFLPITQSFDMKPERLSPIVFIIVTALLRLILLLGFILIFSRYCARSLQPVF